LGGKISKESPKRPGWYRAARDDAAGAEEVLTEGKPDSLKSRRSGERRLTQGIGANLS